MQNFDRQYLLTVYRSGIKQFSCGQTAALHIRFSVQKADLETENTAKICLWNLSSSHLGILKQRDCSLVLQAGYGSNLPVIFQGNISFIRTELDGADRKTTLEAVDGGWVLRDNWLSLAYCGSINTRQIIEDLAKQMGLTVIFSPQAVYQDLNRGFSYSGLAGGALDKICAGSGMSWSILNGVLQIKKPTEAWFEKIYLLNSQTGLLGSPKEILITAQHKWEFDLPGWEVEFFLNGAIEVADYVRLESQAVRGSFRVYSLQIEGDNCQADWLCRACLVEV